ncbi:MAG: hypothetical protein GF310_11580 [candidate division Zixibacteria bacterium]|nr:hypothetical protein [candidate division Zixibacteria bacterium]
MKIILIILLIIICCGTILDAESDQKSGEQINWQVISRGATNASSGNYILQGTLDQTGIGWSASDQYQLHSGYWQSFEQAPYICGDANSDDDVNVSDAVYIINYIFVSGAPPPDPIQAGETNCDGSFNISDAVWLILYIFEGGNAPCDSDGDGISDC